jgi:hypothetical protein
MIPSLRSTTMIISMIFLCYPSMSQSWLPEFRANLGIDRIVSRSELHEFLTFLHPSFSDECSARMSVFYFRVNYQGQVDSLYSEGNLKPAEKEGINQNILKTNGNWVIPPNTKKTDQCWFVFPCFIVGGLDKHCPDDQKNSRQLLILRNTLVEFAFQRDAKGRYLLPPNRSYPRIIK